MTDATRKTRTTKKRCPSCLERKNADCFHSDSTKPDGLHPYCKPCKKYKANLRKLEQQLMNDAKFKSLYQGLASVGQKIYKVVPISSPWSIAQIVSESYRINGSRIPTQTAAEYLNIMVDNGMILEPKKGFFVREKIAIKQVLSLTKPVHKDEAMQSQKAKESDASPLDLLSSSLSALDALIAQAQTVKKCLESAALEIEEKFNSGDMAKLKQLKTLLKDL